MTSKGPIPPEHHEIARGSGAAAILMFLHIAVVGYLAFLIYTCARQHNDAGAALLQWQSALLFYLPAYFAGSTYLPTDKLSATVGIIARWTGVIAAAIFVFTGIRYALDIPQSTGKSLLIIIGTTFIGLVLALLLRFVFAALTAPARENYKKNAAENEVSE